MAPVGHLHVGLKKSLHNMISQSLKCTTKPSVNYGIFNIQNSACQTQTVERLDFFDFVGITSDSTLTNNTTYFQNIKFTLINWENVLSLSVLHSELK